MILKKSTQEDIPAIMLVVGEAQDYFKKNSIDQWQNGYPNENTIMTDIIAGESYALWQDNEIIGTVMLSLKDEEDYKSIQDGQWLSQGSYAVIHRIALKNSAKGSGAASFLLQSLKKECIKYHIPSIKIDTHEDNKAMQRFLLKEGFIYCGIVYLKDGSKRVAFELLL